ncbi:hypothetical protein SAMN02746041_01882 [Desulfacinum hydrothermale DSM 13146]|uniref:Uncharacterized protein n=1 Tax=Desulfacinum hydrothermale DSM 13146 TaxID=1121390 RepID=A0A1W1XKD6_9BACT|nr:hypothetical protein SAMN02746041_01882 [Desulfacinum hydrothermale DSM 13146]
MIISREESRLQVTVLRRGRDNCVQNERWDRLTTYGSSSSFSNQVQTCYGRNSAAVVRCRRVMPKLGILENFCSGSLIRRDRPEASDRERGLSARLRRINTAG